MNLGIKSTILATAITAICMTQAFAGSESYNFGENNNKVIKAQTAGGDFTAPGDVKIDFYGHMAFKITSPKGLTMMIDPWRNDPTGAFGVWYPKDFPEVPVDIAMSTHAHFDHDALYRTHAAMNLERIAGTFQLGDVKISGIADKHQCHAPGEINWTKYLKNTFSLDLEKMCPDKSPMSWDNVIYVVETGGLRIGFWGDNRPDPGPKAVEMLKDLDVLIMNIDGSGHILSYAQVDSILERFKPKTVIPGHYLGPAVPASSLKTADEWVDQQADVVKLGAAEWVVNPATVNGKSKSVYYFGSNYKSE
ncbi:MAG: MBL fold metallo-hydrolase [Amphritea sp.]